MWGQRRLLVRLKGGIEKVAWSQRNLAGCRFTDIGYLGDCSYFPTKIVVDSFGGISENNRRIITMEWIGSGLTLIFLGLLGGCRNQCSRKGPQKHGICRDYHLRKRRGYLLFCLWNTLLCFGYNHRQEAVNSPRCELL